MRLFPRRKYFRQSHVVKFPPYRKEIRHVTVYGRFSRCLDISEEKPIFPGNVIPTGGIMESGSKSAAADNNTQVSLSLKRRIRRLTELVADGLTDRTDTVRSSVLATLCGLNTFLYGPPGTAKSKICRRLNEIFAGNGRYFEHLMHRFCTPEELFGPISISKLKQDEYERKTAGYLADADFAFLDEIWKSSPAVLNTLLTLINERTYHNGNKTVSAPLRNMVVASNEIPLSEDDLAALYDRFIVRLVIEPVHGTDNFRKLLLSAPEVDRDEHLHRDRLKDLAVTDEEYGNWKKLIDDIRLSDELLGAMASLREALSAKYAEESAGKNVKQGYDGFSENEKAGTSVSYISDRRWVQSARYLKAAAFFNEENEAAIKYLILLEDILWHAPSEKAGLRTLILGELRRALDERIRNTDEGKILENSRILDEILTSCSNEQLFTDHNIAIRMLNEGDEPKVTFSMLKDYGFTYVKSNDFWNLESWFRKTDIKSLYPEEVISGCRNQVKDGKTAILLPETGDVIRIILYRDLNGYFSKGDAEGTEVFTFSVPGHRGSDGQSLEEERYTAPSVLMPKLVQLWLKNRLEDRFEMYARISEIQSHFGGLEKKIKTTIRINFEGIFSEECGRAERHAADVAAVKSVVPLKPEERGEYMPGRFMMTVGTDVYILTMENGDRVIYQTVHGNFPPAKGEMLTYERRYNGRGYVWVEKESYRRWFNSEVNRLGMASARHLNCTFNEDNELFAGGLHCVLNDGETPVPGRNAMRLQTINYEKALLELSPEDRLDITSARIPFDEFSQKDEFTVLDHEGRPCGKASSREAPTGRSVKIRFDNGGEVNSFISSDILRFLNETISSFKTIRRIIEENARFIKDTRARLDGIRDSVNNDIFLSDEQKKRLTDIIEEVYAPVNAEIARAGHYEKVASELVDKNSIRKHAAK